MSFETRVIIHTPTGKDSRLLAQVLSKSGMTCVVCEDADNIFPVLMQGVGVLVIADEALTTEVIATLGQYLTSQASWSDVPFLILSTRRPDSPELRTRYTQLGNVTLLERPLQSITIISAVTSAMRSRMRQYEMREVNRRKDEFLAMLAHELRNPLAPVSAAAALLKMPNLDNQRIARTSEIISRQVAHMAELIDDLLDVSRVSRGLVAIEKIIVDARDILSIAVEQVQPLIEQRRHHLHVSVPAGPVSVDADQKRLVQIVANLLNNAAKYTPLFGYIRLSLESVSGEVRITVSDTGIGMEASMIGQVFEMFTQAARTPDRSQGGLGIGLALVRSLVWLHGGTVEAASEGVGQGSTFTVRLPSAKPHPAPNSVPEIDNPSSHIPFARVVLIVDDNVDAAEMLARLLESAGYQTFVEHTGLGGIERAKVVEPQVFLLDVGLPDMSGIKLAKVLRSMPTMSEALMIAITGYGQESDSRDALEAGFDYHMVKPVEINSLLSIIAPS
jgi:signal transduction histidine kinase